MTKQGCIINPQTGRAVKTTTALGKKLMAQAQQLDDEYNAGAKLKAAAKRAVVKKPEPPKRAVVKKPEPPKPAEKFGFEDLPGDVKNLISGVVKKNRDDDIKSKKKSKMERFANDLYSYYKLGRWKDSLHPVETELASKTELYDYLYNNNELYEVIKSVYFKEAIKILGSGTTKKVILEVKKDDKNNEKYLKDLLVHKKYKDNKELYDYLLNHPVNKNKAEWYKNYFVSFLTEDYELELGNPKGLKSQTLTLVETMYDTRFKNIPAETPSTYIPLRVFHIKLDIDMSKGRLFKDVYPERFMGYYKRSWKEFLELAEGGKYGLYKGWIYDKKNKIIDTQKVPKLPSLDFSERRFNIP